MTNLPREAIPSLRRMPGTVIAAIVLLSLNALFSLLSGLTWLALSLVLGGVLLAGGILSVVLIVGLSRRKRWARTAGLVFAAVLTAFFFVEAMRTVGTDPSSTSALWFYWLLVFVSLYRRNTMHWCDGGGPAQTPIAAAERGTPKTEDDEA
ncbi:hypothetical protein [Glycomyces terrestris]|uniref:Uncharacterized protein n=1 Tax=Glycomyces terrestris TaxID=2493553 RepID=A0A426V4L2_9ACTN|nr:hypothetical protein [Glycomyces terrestris]RRS01760.1 hypothetical protein EIW28_03100 [Glycomyces terrestris]